MPSRQNAGATPAKPDFTSLAVVTCCPSVQIPTTCTYSWFPTNVFEVAAFVQAVFQQMLAHGHDINIISVFEK
eukprot:1106886-Amphidinium_carterae.1